MIYHKFVKNQKKFAVKMNITTSIQIIVSHAVNTANHAEDHFTPIVGHAKRIFLFIIIHFV